MGWSRCHVHGTSGLLAMHPITWGLLLLPLTLHSLLCRMLIICLIIYCSMLMTSYSRFPLALFFRSWLSYYTLSLPRQTLVTFTFSLALLFNIAHPLACSSPSSNMQLIFSSMLAWLSVTLLLLSIQFINPWWTPYCWSFEIYEYLLCPSVSYANTRPNLAYSF